jgi:hypothetical protein
MRLGLIVAAMLAVFVPGGPSAVAAVVGDASVPYSATRTVTIDGRDYLDKVFHVPGKEREDVNVGGIPMDFILDLDRARAAVILPALVSYVEIPLPPLLAQFDRHRLDGKAVGEDRIDGVPATKYRIDFTASDRTRGNGFLWLSRDNILLRIEGKMARRHRKPTRISMMLSDLRLGPQDRSLFMVPKGLHRIPPQALDVLLSLGRKKHHH